jgi:hypothetical protein
LVFIVQLVLALLEQFSPITPLPVCSTTNSVYVPFVFPTGGNKSYPNLHTLDASKLHVQQI